MPDTDTPETKEGRVYRVGNDFPITLILPYQIERVNEGDGIGILKLFTQADISEDGQVEVAFVNNRDYPVPTSATPSEEEVLTLASSAFQDLGIVHPGVAELLNFAEDFVA